MDEVYRKAANWNDIVNGDENYGSNKHIYFTLKGMPHCLETL